VRVIIGHRTKLPRLYQKGLSFQRKGKPPAPPQGLEGPRGYNEKLIIRTKLWTDNIMYYLITILFGVVWILTSIVRNYASTKSPISHKYLNHGTYVPVHNNSNSISPLLSKAGRMMKVFSSKFLVFFKNARVTSRCALNLIGLALFIYILSFPPHPTQRSKIAVGWGREGNLPGRPGYSFSNRCFFYFCLSLTFRGWF
jgi:hypothetical protein